MQTDDKVGGLLFAFLTVGYIILFYISQWLGGQTLLSANISLFFLPAIIRLLGVLLIGAKIIPSLMIASLYLTLTGSYDLGPGNTSEFLMGVMTAVGGPLAVILTARIIRLRLDLRNLSATRLLILSAACSLGNALALGITLFVREPELAESMVFLEVFSGDMIGTWVAIYAIKLGLDAYAASSDR
jgi:hypothetical protein